MGAGNGMSGGIRNKRVMYKSSLRHVHDPVISSLKLKGIRLLFLFICLYRDFVRNADLLSHSCSVFLHIDIAYLKQNYLLALAVCS
jgi:hypothetical protein